MIKVALDAGHGMNNRTPDQYDPGVIAYAREEADVALKTALTVKFFLDDEDIAFYLLRKGKQDGYSVAQRPVMANRHNCSHYISFHMNAASPGVSGTETFFRSEQDKALARVVQKAAIRAFGLKDRGVKHESESQYERLAIFAFNGPACLCEMGFQTNIMDLNTVWTRNNRIIFGDLISAYFDSLREAEKEAAMVLGALQVQEVQEDA